MVIISIMYKIFIFWIKLKNNSNYKITGCDIFADICIHIQHLFRTIYTNILYAFACMNLKRIVC